MIQPTGVLKEVICVSYDSTALEIFKDILLMEKKNRVKVTVIFRGRELAYKSVGAELLQKVAEEVMDWGTVEQPPREEGRNLSMFIVPK